MTESQEKFILSLISSRVVPAADAALNLATLTVPQASALIDRLKVAPWKARTTTFAQSVDTPAERGYYKFEGEVYCVTSSRMNKDRSIAKILESHLGEAGRKVWSWEYTKGMVYKLKAGHKITLAEAKDFGHLHGQCLVCMKPLTDPKSVEAGIGPVCAKKF